MAAVTVKHPGGRPTKYNEAVLAHAQEYLDRYRKLSAKQPYLEELALEMDLDDETLKNWSKARNEDGSLKYPEFFATIKRIMVLQKLRLLEKTQYQFPAGSIFQLKANHNMIEAEKRIIAGDKDEPLEITFTDERKIVAEVTE